MLRKILLMGLVAAALGSSPQASGDEPYFIWLGHLPGGVWSGAYAVSDDGAVVVGSAGSPGVEREAFRWTADEGMVGLGFLPTSHYDPWSSAHDVSADGAVVIGTSRSDELGLEAFRWTQETGMVGLGPVPGCSAETQVTGISADGTVIVGAARVEFRAIPFRWTEDEGMTRLDEEALGAVPSAISHDGSVVVGGYWGGPPQPFRWTAEAGLELLGPLPGGSGGGEAINLSADGSVIVGWSDPAEPSYMEAFRWTADEGTVGLGFLPVSDFSMAWDVSADGSVIVGEIPISGPGSDAFVWTAATGMRDLQRVLALDLGLDMEAADLYYAYGISSNGRYVVGGGSNPDNGGAWLAYLGDPIPCKGDLNADGARDRDDLLTLLESYGADSGGDIDGDGDTDLRDLAWMLAVYGQPCLQW
jgi:probable HAF family extracellular repeat protein